MKKVQEPMVIKTQTVATRRIPWQPLIGLLAGIVVMSVVALSGQELKHVPPAAPTYVVLHSFDGADGASPRGGLILDAVGNLYGTTAYDGASNFGVVFSLSPSGIETVLHSFIGGADGGYPFAGLVQDKAGNLYGTTPNFGAHGAGIVFELIRCDSAPSGYEFKVLYSFTGGADGAYPSARLILDAAGNLYGTTAAGGVCCGVVFKLSPTGTETVLHRFTGGTGLGDPSGLVLDLAGNLYGTTNGNGSGGSGSNGGVFQLIRSASGYDFSVLYSFSGGADGGGPGGVFGLVRDAAGNLFGTTYYGGDQDDGVVFEVSPTGTKTVLHSFTIGDGQNPAAGLFRDTAGNLYGTTETGGASFAGVVFKLSTDDTLTVLHSFVYGTADGSIPEAGLIQDPEGNLYGTTSEGGDVSTCGVTGCGVVFKLSP
jgi:uncharacterized repeat protein (TIGR03803 family)